MPSSRPIRRVATPDRVRQVSCRRFPVSLLTATPVAGNDNLLAADGCCTRSPLCAWRPALPVW